MNKPSFALMIAATVVLFSTGCDRKTADNSTGSDTRHVIAVIPKGTTHIYWQSVRAGAEAAN